MSEWFPFNAELREGCVKSSKLFNVYMVGVVREVNARVHGKLLKLLCGNDGRFEINPGYLQMMQNEWLTQRRSYVDCWVSLVEQWFLTF